jgi:hypothetical protein
MTIRIIPGLRSLRILKTRGDLRRLFKKVFHCVRGVTMPPCGVPEYVVWYVQCSMYPAFSIPFINVRKSLSLIFRLRIPRITSWSMLSKELSTYYPPPEPTSRKIF